MTPDRSTRIRSLGGLQPRDLAWLWTGRLALGKLAILDGDPGLGKSLVTLDLCARLSTGRPFPDDTACPGPAAALLLNGEDGPADVVRPRLRALGADLERLFVIERDGPLLFPRDIGVLDEALTESAAKLVVLDPIMAFLDQTALAASDQAVRRALAPLAVLAEKHQCAVVMVRHLNKSVGLRCLYRGSGSIGLLGACRSAWLIAADPEEPERRVLVQLKNNLALGQPSLAYRVEPQPGGLPALTWLGRTSWTADDLRAVRARSEPRDVARQQARAFLASFLAAGPRTTREIEAAARTQGVAMRTLRRARDDLDVQRERRYAAGGHHVTWWLLPGQQLPADEPRDPGVANLDALLTRLNEQYPPVSLLDED